MTTKLNKSDLLILGIFYVISSILNVFDYYDQDETLIEYLIDIPMFSIASFIGLLVFMYYIIPRFLIERKNYVKFTLYAVLVVLLIGVTERVTGFLTNGSDWEEFPNAYNLILYSIFNGADAVGFPLGILLTKKFYESQSQISKIKEQQKENELKLLRSQIDPHFLFNNLNTLDSLIDRDSDKAKEYINRLSLIYRYLIQTKDAEVMELSKELQFAENYIFLMKTRFEDDYSFNIVLNTTIEDKFIPTGALQALLENVVKHNKPLNKGTVKADITIEEHFLKVENSKQEFLQSNKSLGTGLNNLKSRYQLLTDDEVMVINKQDSFKVTIPIIKLTEE
ncbi:sensor histidine kinase [Seonamhaeicola marinus]|uniref:Histidine kinase n=1 Tax=Seonamhaeicola marinus TaxID=1912246 RepID=A0A5D0HSI8_9FLAO|nr:histidine kinase [Seonamhaeicola marinus]TYA74215.1 histidine kinase [Seonamhaeicola marinus]